MVHAKYLPLLLGLVILLSIGSLAENATIKYYCPQITCLNTPFSIWVEYWYNGTALTNASVSVIENSTTYNLTYNSTYEDYRKSFTISSLQTSNYTIQANGSYGNLTANCSTQSYTCYNLTVEIYQEKPWKIYANTSQYAVRVRNYDKQLDTPYINDFSWIIARNNDHNSSNNDSCNLETGSQQKALEFLNIGNWMGTSTVNSIVDLLGDHIGCNKFWFRARYLNGQAILALPWAGNYTLSLLEGSIIWHGDYTPPDIIKSNMFIPLGTTDIPNKNPWTAPFWVSHGELNAFGSFMDSLYIFFIIGGFLIFVALIMTGLTSISRALGITILWWVFWTIARML